MKRSPELKYLLVVACGAVLAGSVFPVGCATSLDPPIDGPETGSPEVDSGAGSGGATGGSGGASGMGGSGGGEEGGSGGEGGESGGSGGGTGATGGFGGYGGYAGAAASGGSSGGYYMYPPPANNVSNTCSGVWIFGSCVF